MKTIYKYGFDIEDSFTIALPRGAEILCVQTQNGGPQLWALVDPAELKESRCFELYGTGHPYREGEQKYIGTFQLLHGDLVFHLFERIV